MLDDKGMTEPLSVFLDMLVNPLLGPKSQRAERV
jgi:hypothetical protein